MNIKKILPIILIFVAAIVAFILSTNTNKKINEISTKSSQEQAKTQGTSANKKTESFTKKTSMLDLMNSKQAVRCTFSKNDEKTNLEGTMYTDGTNARTNINTTVEGVQVTANTIVAGKTVYIWQSNSTQGMQMDIEKFKQDNETNAQNPTPTANKENIAAKADELFDYNCSTWNVNPDMFTVPTGITFVDITEAMNKIQQTPCAICDTMTDETRKAQCKQSLNCK